MEEERTEVTADFLNLPKELLEKVGSSFHVDLLFKVSAADSALKVPVGSLFRDGSAWAVYVADEGRARKKQIEILALGAKEVSIKSGLKVDEQVLVYPGDLVKDGTRIRAKLP